MCEHPTFTETEGLGRDLLKRIKAWESRVDTTGAITSQIMFDLYSSSNAYILPILQDAKRIFPQ
jgi:hypothetical protein